MSEKISIVQCYTPPLVAGTYTVKVDQMISNKTVGLQDLPFSKSLEFGVDAARFTLNDADIYSVYPPANQYGNYEGSLPHIVFTRRTLPWERTIDGKPPLFQTTGETDDPKQQPPLPWMALILLDETEMNGLKIVKNTLANVILPDETTVTHPAIHNKNEGDSTDLQLMEWENTTDGCFTIDLTKTQFETYAPSLDSLPYLAHSKRVNIDNKDKAGITDLDGDAGVFSVIVGSALIPETRDLYTALLVSLEGFADYLAPSKGQPPKNIIPEGNFVRMVVVANWKFSNSGDKSFFELVEGLAIKTLKITKGMDNPSYAAAIGPYFEPGYVPMEHQTRTGVTSVSWYHGPFTPKLLPKSTQSLAFINADAALRYDGASGFFDVSFAAAWQLGRMLALQNQSFSKAMLNWRIKQKQILSAANLANTLNAILNDQTDSSVKDKVIKYLGGTPLNAKTASAANTDIPPAITAFLAQLYRLNGMPFGYLVPNELLLEDETLALFYVDPNWIEAMLDGALSIGRASGTYAIMNGGITDFTSQITTGTPFTGTDVSTVANSQLNVTGFLLRSALISGWRGIEIEAFDANGTLLPALRFERVDSGIFLGVFNGNVTKIVITQPYEGLHFGFKVNNTIYSKDLKNETDGTCDESINVNDQLGTLISQNGVINIAKLAAGMQQKLPAGWLGTSFFTSAEFAFQMVDSPVQHTIDVTIQVQ